MCSTVATARPGAPPSRHAKQADDVREAQQVVGAVERPVGRLECGDRVGDPVVEGRRGGLAEPPERAVAIDGVPRLVLACGHECEEVAPRDATGIRKWLRDTCTERSHEVLRELSYILLLYRNIRHGRLYLYV